MSYYQRFGSTVRVTNDRDVQITEKYGEPDIVIDSDAKASRADTGVWVSAWVWLPDKD